MTTPTHEKKFPSEEVSKLPRPFILRRLHSLLGIWLVLYLCEHLLVNSQMALFFDDDGKGFISMVNKIHALPYLPAIELLFLGVPFLIHGVWGVIYLQTAKFNSRHTNGSQPALPQYKRNHAYTWQRITSWILLIGIAAHVIHMRFVEYPSIVYQEGKKSYLVPVRYDKGLSTITQRLHSTLYTSKRLQQQDMTWAAAHIKPLKEGEVLIQTPNAGTAFLFILRDTFKSPTMVILYSLLVVATCYHAFNGMWTALITWGVTLTRRSQRTMRHFTTCLMIVVMGLGLMAAWGSYWTTWAVR